MKILSSFAIGSSRRWAFLKELIPLALVLIIADHLFFANKLFAFQPSPLWLLIILIAPRGGSIAGIVCGLTAAVLNLCLLHSQGFLWEDLLHRDGQILLGSGLFIFFGAYLGAISENQLGRIGFFKNKAASLSAQLDSEQINRAELERKCEEMEKRIAGAGATVQTFNANFKRLGQAASEDDLVFALDYILAEESKAKNYGIWRISKGEATLVTGNFSAGIPPLALAVSKNHKTLSAADWSRRHKRNPGADLAALIMDNGSERLVAAVAGCPFTRMTRTYCLRISMLAEQAGLVLTSLRDKEKLIQHATLDTESGLVSETYLRRRIKEEIAQADQYGGQLALLACSIASPSEKRQPLLEIALSSSIRASIRYSDGVAWFPEIKAFVIVMPQCDQTRASELLKKIKSNLELLNLRDARNNEIYQLAANSYVHERPQEIDTIFARLFAGIAVGAHA